MTLVSLGLLLLVNWDLVGLVDLVDSVGSSFCGLAWVIVRLDVGPCGRLVVLPTQPGPGVFLGALCICTYMLQMPPHLICHSDADRR